MRRELWLVGLMLVLAVGLGVQPSAGAVPPPPAIGEPLSIAGPAQPGLCFDGCGGVLGVPSSNEAYEQEVVERVNAERANAGLPPLKRVAPLDDAARYHATDMGVDDYFDHKTHDRVNGELVEICAFSTRVDSFYPDRSWIGENIAAGYSTPAAVMNGWMGSTGHRNNILSTNYWELGVGYYQGSGHYFRYWVQNFGRRYDIYPLIIDREAATTDNTTVELYLYGAGTWSEMRLRNDGGAWGSWQPFATDVTWELAPVPGVRTVEVELRSGGTTTTSSDTIRLTQPSLAPLPGPLAFTYDKVEGTLSPTAQGIIPTNETNSIPLEWTVIQEGDWFTLSRTTGTTPQAFYITPDTAVLAALPAGTYTGAVTVTVTSPADTLNSPQRIELSVAVRAPRLGGLPDAVTFTHYIPDDLLLPSARTFTPQNTGSDHTLSWTASKTGSWFSLSRTSGSTPQSFDVMVGSYDATTPGTYTGRVTVTITEPAGTEGSPHEMDLTLRVVNHGPERVYLPLVLRNYTPPPVLRYPNDPRYISQWGLVKVDAPLAWGRSLGDGVLIAVLDSGADYAHPDLMGKLRTDIAWDYVNNDSVAQDDNGHGTHVTGIAAAATDNGQGVAGLGWNAQVVPLKILDDEGNGSFLPLIEAIYRATDNGAEVINLSLSTRRSAGDFYCTNYPALIEALQDAYHRGVLTVVAAGNDNYDAGKVVPANCPYVLTVGATDSADQRASFSNVGSVIDVAAPGVSIESTYWPSPYASIGGTSMATPFVSGLAALVRAEYPHYTPDQVAAAILDNAVDLGDVSQFGCGRINAGNAVLAGTAHAVSQCRPHALAGPGVAAAEVVPLTTPPAGAYVPGRLIVRFRPGVSAASSYLRALQVEPERTLLSEVWTVSVPAGAEVETAQRLLAAGLVEYAHLDLYVHAQD